MNIHTIEVGPIDANCFVVWDKTDEAIVIDPGYDAEKILSFLKANNLSVAAYLLTHGHFDHISALADMCDVCPAPVSIHNNDLEWAFDYRNSMLPLYPTPRRPEKVDRVIDDGQSWTDGGMLYKIILTPGHTPGGVCYHFPGDRILFSGDTLFEGSVGRTDLPGGDARVLSLSLAKLAKLPDTTAIYPGHGPDTVMAQEKRLNYFMQRSHLMK